MKEEDEWIKEYDHLIISGKKYWFRCVWCLNRKAPNSKKPSMQLEFNIYKDGEGWLDWNEFNGSYLAEKLTDYIKNSINGQRTCYWNNKEGRNFEG